MTGRVEIYLKHGSKKPAHEITGVVATRIENGFYVIQTLHEMYCIKQDDISHIKGFGLVNNEMRQTHTCAMLIQERKKVDMLVAELTELRQKVDEMEAGGPTS